MSGSFSQDFPAIAGQLYARWTLDCLPELAYAISKDAIARPQLYQRDDIPDDLVHFRMSYGIAPNLPNLAQRQSMITPLLGASDGLRPRPSIQSAFQVARRKFADACSTFAEQASHVEAGLLEDRVRSAAATLHAHFQGIYGKSFRMSSRQIQDLFEAALRILSSHGITSVFGIDHLDPGWPFHSLDANGAKLVESIGNTLPLSGNYKMAFTDFPLVQRTAQEGAEAIRLLLEADPLSAKDLAGLIRKGYTWSSSLKELPTTSATPTTSTSIVQPRTSAQRASAPVLPSIPR